MVSMRLKIGFRVEGDAEIGIGHVVRCLSLAKTLTHHGHSVVFSVRARSPLGWLRSQASESLT